jgi:hypothetical protein
MIRPALKYVARPERQTEGIDHAIDWLKGKTSAFMLAWNFGVSLKQFFGSTSAINEIGLTDYLAGFKVFFTGSPYRRYLEMTELSPYMKQRSTNFDREIRDMFKRLTPDQRRIYFGDKAVTWSDVQNAGFVMIRMADTATVLPVWHAAFHRHLRTNAGDLDGAVKFADDVIRKTQDTSQPFDLTHWQRAGGVYRLFSAFQSFTIGKYGQRQRLYWNAFRQGKISTTDYAMFNFYDAILPAVGMTLLFAVLWGKDFEDEETWYDMAKDVLEYMFMTGIPVVGTLFSKFGGPMDSALAKFPNEVQRAIRNGAKYIDEQDDETLDKIMWNLFRMASFVSGVPVSQIVEKALKGAEQDEEIIPGVKYVVPAPKK